MKQTIAGVGEDVRQLAWRVVGPISGVVCGAFPVAVEGAVLRQRCYRG